MAFNENLAERARTILQKKDILFDEKKMMGGLCFMVDGKMCLGIMKEELMARVGPDKYEEALSENGARQMDFTGRPLKGYVFVEQESLTNDDQIAMWIQWCLDFNPLAKASKKRTKKKKKD